MTRTCRVAVNGQTFKAKAGDVLLDAALINGVNIPHDCRSGVCGSCHANVAKGSTILGETAAPGVVRACQARILSDLDIEIEEVPDVSSAAGYVAGLRALASDVVEVTIKSEGSTVHRPGQYFNFKFEGFPVRSYSPTRPLHGRLRPGTITLQVRRLKGGRVSGQLGRGIRSGHPVVVEGPYGSAFFREGKTGRLILISSGTGFAPIWSIACAALRENPSREILIIAGVRTADPIYMTAALERLVRYSNVNVIVTIGRRPGPSGQVREGYPSDHVPELSATDIVYACGPAHMIETLSPFVVQSKAQFYFDPFEPAAESSQPDFFQSLKRLTQFIAGRERAPALQNGVPQPA